jgi:RNA polymerase sigma-70 factor, ECF subfamily
VAPVPAFDEVYAKNVDYVWRILVRLGVAAADVEDVAQDVFVVVCRKLPEFEGRSSVRTWLFQLARNVVHDYRRTHRRKGAREGDDEKQVSLARASEEHRPDVTAARAQAVRILHELLDKLDDEKREVFVLADLEQLSVPQVAEALGVNLNTVYSRLRLAREAFNRELSRHNAREGRQS